MAGKAKAKLVKIQAEFKAELKISNGLLNRMWYFDDLVNVSKNLTLEAAGLLELTKKFENRLDDMKKELIQDYTDEDIDDNLEDEDFANDFAESLHSSFMRLSKMCDEVSKDCVARKAKMIKMLVHV